MLKIICGITACACILIFVPSVSAMQINHEPDNDIFIENVCDPDSSGGAYQLTTSLPLDFQQIENVRIELLERGFNPGFHAERDNENNPQLNEALLQFQFQNALPVTGQIDAPTLEALSLPIHKPVHRAPDPVLQRAHLATSDTRSR